MSAASSGPIEISVSEPWFTAIKRGLKTVEGRLNKSKFAEMRPGTVLVISKSGPDSSKKKSGTGTRSIRASTSSSAPFVAVVTQVVPYQSFVSYLSHEGLNRCLPGIDTIEAGANVYRQFYSSADEATFGIVAIHLTLA